MKLVRLLHVTFFVACSAGAMADNVPNLESQDKWRDLSLISGRVTSVDELQSAAGAEEGLISSHVRVSLRKILVLRGSFSSEEATIDLLVTHTEVLQKGDEIIVLVDRSNSNMRVLYWGFPMLVACVPEELVRRLGLSTDFRISNTNPKELCTNARWFK